LPLLGDAAHEQLVDNLKHLATIVPSPSAIVVISAHWEEAKPTITSGAYPPLLYDYYGFPPESYEILYPVPGKPALARRMAGMLTGVGMEPVLDEQRGFDHGLFVPLKIMYPDATSPCVQLSLVRGLDPAEHVRMGKALAGLRDEPVLIVGSGFSFHNMQAFFSPSTDRVRSMNGAFEDWLVETCSSQALSESERERRLVEWTSAPAARFCHPREEHLVPLHVCYGIAQAPARQVFRFEIMGKAASAYLW
jgi:aromatic ring-opening dioxygenase catalytic subunit (LigB family)